MACHTFKISADYAVHELIECIETISAIPPASATPHDFFCLFVNDVEITPPILFLLVHLLTLSLPQVSPGSVSKKWFALFLTECWFAQPSTTTLPNPPDDDAREFCSPDSLHTLASLLARRSPTLGLNNSPEILECLFDLPELEVSCLFLEDMDLPDLQCERLVALIQRSVSLTHLTIQGSDRDVEDPQMLMDCFTNLVQLPDQLAITEGDRSTPTQQLRQPIQDEVVRQGDTDSILRLLRNSPSQLQRLGIINMRLEDSHFIRIVEALPSSELRDLDVARNNIRSQGVLALAQHLPRIKCLKAINLGYNPWEYDQKRYEQCWAALLQGLIENYSIEFLTTSHDRAPFATLITYYCYLNWAGRRLLTTPGSTIPLGLWPLILGRAGKDNGKLDVKMRDGKLRASSVYFLLQNSPIFFHISAPQTL